MLLVVLSMIAGTLSNGILYASTDDTGDTGEGQVDEPQPQPEPEPEPEPVVPEPEPVLPEKEEAALPYCDTPEGEAAPGCHDRYDYDELTGLYPCNDGSQATDPLDCNDASVPPAEEDPCLFDTSLPECQPVDGKCPEGYGMNGDGACFPLHPQGCPSGYHSHEDDETGECIPDDEPCADGYIMNPDYPECGKIDRICAEHPDLDGCPQEPCYYPAADSSSTECEPQPCPPGYSRPEVVPPIGCEPIPPKPPKPPGNGNGNGNGEDNDIIIKIRNEINNINVIKSIVKNNPADFEVDLVAIGINSDGSAMKCLMDVNRAEANCEEFRVPGDRINGAFKVFIEFESGAKDRAAQNTYLKSLKDDINDIDFIEDNVENADLGVDLAAIGINPGGQGLECIINLDNEKAECEEFKVPSDKISGQITEIVEFD
jgi:hypothetical protein